jgi:CheY-like chemotaxis protein
VATADGLAPIVLVIDDVESNRRLLEILMQSEGYEVRVAGTGTEALSSIDGQPPDVIVLDLALPDMHGSEFIEKLHNRGIDIPVLIVTGDSSAAARTATAQAAEFLLKPYDVDALVEAVGRLLGRGTRASDGR